jgi:hypothetical protein
MTVNPKYRYFASNLVYLGFTSFSFVRKLHEYSYFVSINQLHSQFVGKTVNKIIAPRYGLDDWGSRVRFPVGAGNFSLHHRDQKGSGAHPASYPMGTTVSFSEVKVAGA